MFERERELSLSVRERERETVLSLSEKERVREREDRVAWQEKGTRGHLNARPDRAAPPPSRKALRRRRSLAWCGYFSPDSHTFSTVKYNIYADILTPIRIPSAQL